MRAVKWRMYDPCNILSLSASTVPALPQLSSSARFWPFHFTPGLSCCGHKTPAVPCLDRVKSLIYGRGVQYSEAHQPLFKIHSQHSKSQGCMGAVFWSVSLPVPRDISLYP